MLGLDSRPRAAPAATSGANHSLVESLRLLLPGQAVAALARQGCTFDGSTAWRLALCRWRVRTGQLDETGSRRRFAAHDARLLHVHHT